VRVAAQHGNVDVERPQQFGGHEAEQVGAGRLVEAGCVPERLFGTRGAAQDVGGLEHDDVESGTGEQHRGDQTVVARSDDHHVGARR
jgi:hypothetical protein